MDSDFDLQLTLYTADTTAHLSRPVSEATIRAGFPSPGQDYVNLSIDLNRYLIKHPAATFFARVEGLSMSGEGIDEGDLLVIDRSLKPENNDLAVCCIEGDFTLKRIQLLSDGNVRLLPSNPDFKPIDISTDDEFSVWGIVTATIKQNRKPRKF